MSEDIEDRALLFAKGMLRNEHEALANFEQGSARCRTELVALGLVETGCECATGDTYAVSGFYLTTFGKYVRRISEVQYAINEAMNASATLTLTADAPATQPDTPAK